MSLPKFHRNLLSNARKRAKEKNLPFRIAYEDLLIPEQCPCCFTYLKPGVTFDGTGNSPSIDRLIPELGYIPENIVIICNRCNRRKAESSPKQLYQIADFFHAKIKERGLHDGGSGSDDRASVP